MQLNKTEALRQAQQFLDSGRVSAAIRLYKEIVDADASDLSLISLLGELYVKAGRIQEAVEHFLRIAENYLQTGSAISATHVLKKVLRLDPTTARALMHLGELCVNEGRINDAHGFFIEAGAAFWHKGNTSAAIKMNERALAITPDSRQAKTALALLEQEINQPELPATPKKAPPTREVEQILISIPDEPDTAGVAVAADHSGLLPELLFDPGEPVSPEESPEWMGEDEIIEQIATAELLVAHGQTVQAVALLRETLHHRPDHIQLRAKLKDIYLRTAMIERASEECLNIAAIYAARGENSRARDYVLRARLLSPSVDPIVPSAQKSAPAQDSPEQSLEWTPEPIEPLRVM
ncbi:MAG: tetratricopeptide repeat protein [Blastocatellia bacterium]